MMNRYAIYNNNTTGTVSPAHNCNNWNPDADYAFARDWKLFPFLYKGKLPCKYNNCKKHFSPDRIIRIRPVTQYISDRHPCGVTRQQLDSVRLFFVTVSRISLSRFLNGSAGYRTDSEDSFECPGWSTVFNIPQCINQNTGTDTVIPYICLERRSIVSIVNRLKNRYPFLNFESAGKSVLQ
jgi:hypothetical protein